ncbi:MAG: adenosine kinase [Deltaproteobacteria bacterium]|nr:adenosine kinase [Deltaproteobacteria bacterium]
MRRYHVYGIGNALVDLQMRVSDEDFATIATEKGTMRLVDFAEQEAMLERLKNYEIKWSSGGSVANSINALAQLGAKGAFGGLVGDDAFGDFFAREMENFDIAFPNEAVEGKHTGTSAIVITPDSERTMRTHLGAASTMTEEDVSEEIIAESEWLFFEGYLFDQPGGQRAAQHAIELCKKHGTKIAITASEAFVIEHFGVPFRAAADQADLLFFNQKEAQQYTGLQDEEACFARLKELKRSFAMTRHSEGAWAFVNGQEVRVPAFEVNAIDATGAGDMFAGAFLYGLTQNLELASTTTLACFLASRVVSQVGARLEGNARSLAEKKGLLSA